MAEAVLFNLATAILESIAAEMAKPVGFFASQKIQSFIGVKDKLQSLKGTVQTIRAVLLDAEKQQWHNNELKLWLKRLRDALYDIHDLLDDVATEVLRRKVTAGNEMSKTVRDFFSKPNQLAHWLKVANKIQEIRKNLDWIKNDRELSKLEQHLSEETIGRRKKPETPSPDGAIIGREEDKKWIKQLLFGSSLNQSVSVVAVVGKGGLGKTALARLVYNDGDVKKHFGLKMWVCVSDVFDVNLIIKEILKSAKHDCQGHGDDEMKELLQDLEDKPLDQLPNLLHDILGRKKYMLVLDDLWNEDRRKWLELRNWLDGGLRGSRILVTTRSQKAAKTDENSVIHVLGGLSKDKSWNLFRKMAFRDGVKSLDPQLEEIGRDIVKKCAGVPLAIKTVGGLLYRKNKNEWLRYKVHELPEISEIDENDDGIMQVLKFSYDHLRSCLKHCFAYCSLFPKDHVYKKVVIIHLWMAQGFIESPNRKNNLEEAADNYLSELIESQDNLEEAADNYLSELICRSFLDPVQKGNNGEVLTFKMHDLMHDLAQKVAGGECKIVNFEGGDNDGGIRHASFISKISSEEKMVSLLKTSKLRTFLYLKGESSVLKSHKVLSMCKRCRALCLDNIDIPLPPSLGKLKHLRFLQINENQSIQSLPDSITDLVNLQTLMLSNCKNLKTFPRDLRKLVNLRHLSIDECDSLSHLPSLSVLPSLKTLILWNLVALEFLQQTSNPKQSNTTCPFFPFLQILILFNCGELKGWCERRQLVEEYQKHQSYNSLPSFPKLKYIIIRACVHLNFLPPLPRVEFMDIDNSTMLERQLLANPNCSSKAVAGSTSIPFSRLKHLRFLGRGVKPSMVETLFGLASKLESITVTCYDLGTLSHGMRHLSSLQKLDILNCTRLDLSCQEDEHGTQWQFFTNLRALKITNCHDLEALPEGIQHVTTLQSLEISHCWGLKSLPEWIGNFSLLEKLVFFDCPWLEPLPYERSNLTRLKELTKLRVVDCPRLKEWCLTQEHIPVIVWEDGREVAWGV